MALAVQTTRMMSGAGTPIRERRLKFLYKHGEKAYDPRVQVGAGDGHPRRAEPKAHPSHGGSVPSHKDPTEGTGSNYHKNTNQTRIPGDGAITVRTVMDKKEVRRNLVDADQDVSSRTKNTWGN